MPGFDGTGPRGMGPVTGGGRGFCSPWGRGAAFRRGIVQPYSGVPYAQYSGFGFRGTSPLWPYVGRGRGGLPRCRYFAGVRGAPIASGYAPYYGAAWDMPYGPSTFTFQMTREREIDFLKSEAKTVKEQLEQIEAMIGELETEES